MVSLKQYINGYTITLGIAWIIYVTLSLSSPESIKNAERYDISMFALILLSLSVFVPLFLIWFCAVAGWSRFHDFVGNIKIQTRREAYNLITIGLSILALQLILVPIASSAYRFIGGSVDAAEYVIASNYESTFVKLIGFAFIFWGSIRLLRMQKQKIPLATKILNVGVPVGLFGAFYSLLVFSNPARQTSVDSLAIATYHMPDELVVGTIMIPVVMTWALGLMIIVNMEHYSRYSMSTSRRGIINFFNGMLMIVAATVLTQIFESLGASRTGELGLGPTLIIVYVLLGIIGLGFALIARGALQMRQQMLSKKKRVTLKAGAQ